MLSLGSPPVLAAEVTTLAMKYTVTALDRSGMGHPNYHTPGRSWPSGQPVEVEVLDQDDDPMLEKFVEGEKRSYADPVRIGRVAWKRICADKRLTVRPAGDNVQDVQGLASQLATAESARDAANARAAAAEARVLKLEQEGPESAQKSLEEITRLNGVVEALKGELDKANARAAAVEAQVEELAATKKSRKGG